MLPGPHPLRTDLVGLGFGEAYIPPCVKSSSNDSPMHPATRTTISSKCVGSQRLRRFRERQVFDRGKYYRSDVVPSDGRSRMKSGKEIQELRGARGRGWRRTSRHTCERSPKKVSKRQVRQVNANSKVKMRASRKMLSGSHFPTPWRVLGRKRNRVH